MDALQRQAISDDLESALSDTKTQLSISNRARSECAETLRKSEKRLQDLEARKGEVQKVVDEKQKDVKNLEFDLTSKKKSFDTAISGLKVRDGKLGKELVAAQKELKEVGEKNRRMLSLSTQLRTAESSKGGCEASVKGTTEKIDATENDVLSLEKQLKDATKKRDAASKKRAKTEQGLSENERNKSADEEAAASVESLTSAISKAEEQTENLTLSSLFANSKEEAKLAARLEMMSEYVENIKIDSEEVLKDTEEVQEELKVVVGDVQHAGRKKREATVNEEEDDLMGDGSDDSSENDDVYEDKMEKRERDRFEKEEKRVVAEFKRIKGKTQLRKGNLEKLREAAKILEETDQKLTTVG
jgi:chromosome segregation ATPase